MAEQDDSSVADTVPRRQARPLTVAELGQIVSSIGVQTTIDPHDSAESAAHDDVGGRVGQTLLRMAVIRPRWRTAQRRPSREYWGHGPSSRVEGRP